MKYSNHWRGGRHLNKKGYVLVWNPDHPNAFPYGYVFEHVQVASNVLGRSLVYGEVIHHIDQDKTNNSPSNLLICSYPYHNLLHARLKAYRVTGSPDQRPCRWCKKYDVLNNMVQYRDTHPEHRECNRLYQRDLRRRREVVR